MAANPNDIGKVFASIKKFQASGVGAGGASSGNSAARYAAIDAALKAANQQPTEQKKPEGAWDKFWHPAGAVLNALGSVGYAVEGGGNARFDYQKSYLDKLDQGSTPKQNPLELEFNTDAAAFKGFGQSFVNAWDGHADQNKTGKDLIETGTDIVNKSQNPDYKDTADNVNPWVKGIGGFVADVATDPLTYLPGGLIESGIKGAGKAAVTASKALPETVSSLERTAAMGASVIGGKGFREGVKAYNLKSGAQNLQRLQIKAGLKAIRKGTAEKPDLEFLQKYASTRPVKAAMASDPAIAKALGDGAITADKNADRLESAARGAQGALDPEAVADLGPATAGVVKAAQPATTGIESIPEVQQALGKTVSARQAAALDPAANAVAKALPTPRTAALEALQKVTYAKPVVGNAKVRNSIVKLGPIPKAPKAISAMTAGEKATYDTARSSWLTKVNAAVGDEGLKTLRPIKDPEEFAQKAEELVNQTTTGSYEGQKLSDILRGIRSKNRTHDDTALETAARTIGFNGRHFGKMSMTDFFRKKDITGAFDQMALEEKRRASLFATRGIPDGDMMEAIARGTDPDEAKGAAAEDLARMVSESTPAQNLRFSRVWALAGGKAYRDEDALKNVLTNKAGETILSNKKSFGLEGKGAKYAFKNVWEQNKTLSFVTTDLSALSAEAKAAKLIGPAREGFIYDNLVHDVNMLDARLRSLGVSPVTGKLSVEGSLLRSAGLKSPEWAFLGMSDVLNALPREIGIGLLTAGKNLSIAPTLLHDAARYALKAGPDGAGTLSAAEKASAIMNVLNKRIARFPDETMRKYMASEPGQRGLRAMVGTLLSPAIQQKLIEANVRNGAFARTIIGVNAHRASDAAVKMLRASFANPDGTTGSLIDGVKDSIEKLRADTARAGLTGTDAGTAASQDLDEELAALGDIGTQKNIRTGMRMDSSTKINEAGMPLTEDAVTAAKNRVEESVGRAGNGKLLKPGKVAATAAREAAMKQSKEGANLARSAEVALLDPEIDRLAQSIDTTLADHMDPVADLDTIRAQLTMGLPNWLKSLYRVGSTMSGGFGMRDLKVNEVGAAMSTRHQAIGFTNMLNQLTKIHGDDTLKSAWAALRDMGEDDLTKLDGLQPEVEAAAKDLWPAMNLVFDHSEHSLMDRAGLDADHINDYLRRNGVPEEYQLKGGTNGWENAGIWKKWEFDDSNPIDILDSYFRSLQQASVMPGIAASFSREFGHLSDRLGEPMSHADALKAGWKRINPNKSQSGIAQFVDHGQLYPPEMIEQLSVMDKYLATNRVLDRTQLLDRVFATVDPIINAMKASITLWRPGHHVTNMLGEGLMNTLGGVHNPAAYMHALKVMSSRGLVDGDPGNAVKKFMEQNAPDGYTLKPTEDGSGVTMTLGGKTVKYSYDSVYHMLDNAGIVLHHNIAEDLITEGQEGRLVQRNWARGLAKISSPNWLGEVSASRDNVFRIAMAMDVLGKRGFRNLDEASREIAKQVHSFHPTMATLSAFEQRYARRLLYFYTWQRQAISRVFESLIDTPGRITAAPKGLYGLSVGNGVTPRSWGDNEPDDPRIPQYSTGLVTDFYHYGNETLTGGGADPSQDPNVLGDVNNFLWGASLSAPQLDILQTVFGNISSDPRLPAGQQAMGMGQTALGNVLEQSTPILSIPYQLATGNEINGGQITDPAAFLASQTGLQYPFTIFDPNFNSASERTDADAQATRERTLLNFLTGLKFQDLTTPKKAAAAQLLRTEENAKVVKAGGTP